MKQKVQLDLPLLLPDMDAGDECINKLTDWLAHCAGIEELHFVREDGPTLLCIHYDPNLITLGHVERLAKEVGAAISKRYRHEQLRFVSLPAADTAHSLEEVLAQLPGMLHVHVNYAAGLTFVAYDSTVLQRQAIIETARRMGVTLLGSDSSLQERAEDTHEGHEDTHEGHQHAPGHEDGHEGHQHAHEGHDHGSAPSFLPHWMQERWALILVALAGLFLLIGWLGEGLLPEPLVLLLFILAYLAGGYDVATHAIPGLLRGKFDTDVLMLAAAAGAAILGEWAEGAFLLFLFSLGHAGEHYALDRARNAVNALGELMPKTALLSQDGQLVEVAVDTLQVGDVVVVRPGDRVPVDGEVSRGESAIDQSPITGESVPVQKGPRDEVFAGTINQDAALDIRVTRLAKDNTLTRVMTLVAEAQSQQSPTQQLTQRFTARFVPTVLIGTLLFIVVPPLLGLEPWQDSFYRGMLLLVASSPCALALGTPASVLAGIAQAARHGVLIKGGVHLENMGSLAAIAFDKTGTITEGQFNVTDVVPMNGSTQNELLRVAAAVEQQSNHPLAQAVVRAAQEWVNDSTGLPLALPTADGLENIVGRGVRSAINGESILIGSLKLFRDDANHPLDETVVQTIKQLEANGRTTMAVSRAGTFLGVLGLADKSRPNVGQVMSRLQTQGVQHLVMLTGDNQAVAKRIAAEVGLTDVRADLLPEQKLAAIGELKEQYNSIAMVGDGVNDAPALATATVGIAMGGAGTAVALETADVALMSDDLSKLPFAIGLSRASRAIIRQNLAVSLGVIALLLVTSVLGIVQLSGAVILHEGSTIIVVLNALRLLAYRGDL